MYSIVLKRSPVSFLSSCQPVGVLDVGNYAPTAARAAPQEAVEPTFGLGSHGLSIAIAAERNDPLYQLCLTHAFSVGQQSIFMFKKKEIMLFFYSVSSVPRTNSASNA